MEDKNKLIIALEKLKGQSQSLRESKKYISLDDIDEWYNPTDEAN